LSLANLNALANRGKDISTGVLSLILGTSHPQEVALAFLNSAHSTTTSSKSRRDSN
jgi:hypothetical protein